MSSDNPVRGLARKMRVPGPTRTPDANFRANRRALAERMQEAWRSRDVEMTNRLAARLARLGVCEKQVEQLLREVRA